MDNFLGRNNNKIFSFLAIYILFLSSVAGNDENRQRSASEVPFETQQLQLLSLFNNLNFCIREADLELKEILLNFNPLDHLDLYKNPRLVKKFFENLDGVAHRTGFEPYETASSEDTSSEDKTEGFFNVIWPIDDWALLYNTTLYSSQRMNTQMLHFAFGMVLDIKWIHLKSPPYYEVFPQTQTLKWIMLKANGITRPNIVDNDNPENKLRYWRHDPELNNLHGNWHRSFPAWVVKSKFGVDQDRKGELFMYFHHQYVCRDRAERLSNFMPDVVPLSLTEPIGPGDIPLTLNPDLTELVPRRPNQTIKDIPDDSVQTLVDNQDRMLLGISNGYFLYPSGSKKLSLRSNSGSDYLGNAIESSNKSINRDYYGQLHNYVHWSVSKIAVPINDDYNNKDGIMTFMYQTVQDPCFSMLHKYIDIFYNRIEQYKLPPYSKTDLEFSSVELRSVRIITQEGGMWVGGVPVLKTFFEEFTFDISNGLKSCRKVNSKRKYNTTITRLNYQPFEYRINAYCHGPSGTRGIVRIYMAPTIGYDRKPVPQEELLWSMFELDRFPVTLRHGLNVIKRSSLDSTVTIKGHKGFEELANDVRAAVAKNGKLDPYPEKEAKSCGWPQNLLLPRGTEEGMKFKMFIIITSNSTGDYDEDDFPQLPYCGHPSGRYPDGLPMGFPFNRRLGQGSTFQWNVHSNYRFMDVIIQHKGKNPPVSLRENP